MLRKNMSHFAREECEACRTGAPRVSDDEWDRLLRQVPEWTSVLRDDIRMLEREFPFRNFVEALAFTNTIAALAEAAGHHPALLTEWGQVTVTWWTHKIRGLHRNDFILAARTDEAYDDLP